MTPQSSGQMRLRGHARRRDWICASFAAVNMDMCDSLIWRGAEIDREIRPQAC